MLLSYRNCFKTSQTMLLLFLIRFMLLTINCVSGQHICEVGCKCTMYGFCAACEDGYYMQNWTCIKCSANCVNCLSGQTCLGCDAGHYLNKYNNDADVCSPCSEGCNKCLSKGKCLECDTGYFKTDNSCRKCSARCKRCTSDNNCLECNVGFHQNGILCLSCPEGYFEAGDSCSLCPNNCASCSISNECTKCKTGYFGITCTQKCSLGCVGNVCGKDMGNCTCQGNFIGNACHLCIRGKFGPNCTRVCPKHCMTCNSSEKCVVCHPGYYGIQCQFNCRNECSIKRCHKITGACVKCKPYFKLPNCIKCVDGRWGKNCGRDCPDSCLSCLSTTECTKCKTGYHGKQCEKKCSDGCSLLSCEQATGICSQSCKGNFVGQKCDYCKNEMHGQNCSLLCPKNCKGHVCNKLDGKCSEGCNPKFHGTHCNDSCPANCKSCISDTVCQSCEDGHWGERCHKKCPDGCLDSTCRSNGTCSACIAGNYGDYCNIECPNNCKDSLCNMAGYCNDCQAGHFGTFCSELCPPNCFSSDCLRNGSCYSCPSGLYGKKCDRSCRENCHSCTDYTSCKSCFNGFYGQFCQDKCSYCKTGTDCNIGTGDCQFCEDEMYGNKCQSKCNTKCQTCNSSSGRINECLTCKKGSYGRNESSGFHHCNIRCSRNCMNTTCNADNGTCEYGCKQGYWGGQCELECPKNCLHSDCHSDNGTCRQGCLAGFNGDKCDCPVSCICNLDGTCAKCRTGFGNLAKNCTCTSEVCNNVKQCSSCFNSTYYVQSNSCCECNSNCRQNECFSEFHCRHGCKAGFYGSACVSKCSTKDDMCTDCITNTDGEYGGCISCTQGYFLDLHSNTASKHCIECTKTCTDGKCDARTGVCLTGCVNGTWGDRCEKQCFETCSVCHRGTGACMKCVRNTLLGPLCDHECNNRCKDQDCDFATGKCSVGCVVGFYGEDCSYSCNDKCRNRTCDRETGSCDYGCLEGFEGAMCSQERTIENNSSTTKQLGSVILLVSVVILTISVVLVAVILLKRRQSPKRERVVSGRFGEVVTYRQVKSTCDRSEDNSLGIVSIKRNNKQKQRLSGNKKHKGACPESSASNVDNHPTHRLSESTAEYATIERKHLDTMFQEGAAECSETFDDHIYFNADEVMKRKIPLDQLREFVKNKTIDNYVEEFKELPSGLIKPHKVSQKRENILKNRYRDIYPYDSKRVILREGKSDYINASYIDGYMKQRAYIASMGMTFVYIIHIFTYSNCITCANLP
ncbi:multiple epidermal growth factor-like domains protein 10 isoform X1 [Mercenaria mercenaria]|uniref:multiple epidermal growth factor-like domains protein 10 isoform X1 n=1 Tax=Mercenaria mercenaria TaxID=6596 RepID=UPI00234F40DC|nr:multiple epidermal growth factor-like domains protein 10 isoform X1 [Mercenaria mercenaria]